MLRATNNLQTTGKPDDNNIFINLFNDTLYTFYNL